MMEIGKILSEVSGELTADKVLEAYAKSDMFKKNNRKLVEDNENDK